jgi:hypothetical protein
VFLKVAHGHDEVAATEAASGVAVATAATSPAGRAGGWAGWMGRGKDSSSPAHGSSAGGSGGGGASIINVQSKESKEGPAGAGRPSTVPVVKTAAGEPDGHGNVTFANPTFGHSPTSGAGPTGGRDYAREAAGGCAKTSRHFQAMLIKRLHIARRDYKALCYQLFIPVLMVLGGLGLLRAGAITGFPSMQLTTANFNANGRVNPAIPAYPNYAPFFTFKSSATRTASPDITAALAGMPAANISTTEARLQLSPAMVAAIPDPFAFVNPNATLPTQDWQRMSAFLINDKPTYAASKYGAYVFTRDNGNFPSQSLTDSATTTNAVTYSVLHNTTSLHGGPVFMNLINSRLYQLFSGQPAASIVTRSAPLPFTRRQATVFSAIFTFAAAVIILLAFSFIPGEEAREGGGGGRGGMPNLPWV